MVKQWLTRGVLLALTLVSFFCIAEEKSPSILIINSYHKGFVWSDEVTSGIENAVFNSFPEADVSVEYMDTKRNDSASYVRNITSLYREKFSNSDYDLIFTNDDNALEFVLENRAELFGTTPVVYNGVNDTKFKNQTGVVGLLEMVDIKGTIDVALSLQPEVKNIYVINDSTNTGGKIASDFEELKKTLSPDLNITFLDDAPLDVLAKQVAQLESDAIVLLLAYFRDQHGQYYSPESTASTLSNASSVPVYGVWDFFSEHGVVGGSMLSGYRNGEAAGDIGIKVLNGSALDDIETDLINLSQTQVDYKQLNKFNLDISRLSSEVIVKNATYGNNYNALLLLSYSHDNKWNRTILDGMKSSLNSSGLPIRTYTEFMDTKRHTEKAYVNELLELYKRKYNSLELDVVIVSDDNALQFARKYRKVLFPGVPISFAGVNYLDDVKKTNKQNITGVMESYDILGTVKLGLELFPETKKIYVVNDKTTSGKANWRRVNEIKSTLGDQVEFIDPGEVSMQEVLEAVSSLEDDTLILLLAFTTDKSNYRFSFQDSLALIHEKANRPIFSCWDFYLGDGITGGVITSGQEHGSLAGELAVKLLTGESTENVPIVIENPVYPVVDYSQIVRFKGSNWEVPDGIAVINKEATFFEQNRTLVLITIAVMGVLLSLVVSQSIKIIRQRKAHLKLADKAVTDDLTGVKTRAFLIRYLTDNLVNVSANQDNMSVALCYLDLDYLKSVNDNYGHSQGDKYILSVVRAVRNNIRTQDLLCRVGGDEFVVALVGCEEEKANLLCGKINDELQRLSSTNQLSYDMSVSFGISMLDYDKNASITELLEIADKRMYQNKQRKRQAKVG